MDAKSSKVGSPVDPDFRALVTEAWAEQRLISCEVAYMNTADRAAIRISLNELEWPAALPEWCLAYLKIVSAELMAITELDDLKQIDKKIKSALALDGNSFRKIRTHKKNPYVYFKVIEHMQAGLTLEKAIGKVAEELGESSKESTVRDCYYKTKNVLPIWIEKLKNSIKSKLGVYRKVG